MTGPPTLASTVHAQDGYLLDRLFFFFLREREKERERERESMHKKVRGTERKRERILSRLYAQGRVQ